MRVSVLFCVFSMRAAAAAAAAMWSPRGKSLVAIAPRNSFFCCVLYSATMHHASAPSRGRAHRWHLHYRGWTRSAITEGEWRSPNAIHRVNEEAHMSISSLIVVRVSVLFCVFSIRVVAVVVACCCLLLLLLLLRLPTADCYHRLPNCC